MEILPHHYDEVHIRIRSSLVPGAGPDEHDARRVFRAHNLFAHIGDHCFHRRVHQHVFSNIDATQSRPTNREPPVKVPTVRVSGTPG